MFISEIFICGNICPLDRWLKLCCKTVFLQFLFIITIRRKYFQDWKFLCSVHILVYQCMSSTRLLRSGLQEVNFLSIYIYVKLLFRSYTSCLASCAVENSNAIHIFSPIALCVCFPSSTPAEILILIGFSHYVKCSDILDEISWDGIFFPAVF